ncbi:MAG: FtsX-like permease family protein [Spirochaetales bacterium]|uniref:FtsX-like permease family protein n=1 Tax=Candidatus Thalassospirochaeta sargassi TaxID=3119039 RepID=A0AAJ1IDK8_9SPIO|nr:FtsX-like permease family protein [Spirochaetales bacterium]
MPVLLRIAVRNLRQHSSKSLIIGIIMAVGVMILVVGNTLINTIDTGIERSFIDNYTGNIMITGETKNDLSLFGVRSPSGLEETPTIPDFEMIKNHLDEIPGIVSAANQITGFGIINIEKVDEDKGPYMGLLFGIEPEQYREMFSNTIISEGHFLAPGEEGILMSRSNVDTMNEIFELNPGVGVGDKILITAPGSAGFKIREVEIKGIYTLEHESEAAGYISYIDAQTLRVMKGMNLGNQGEVELSDEETSLLSDDSFDAMFEVDAFTGEAELDFEMTEDNLFSILDLDSAGDEAVINVEDMFSEDDAGAVDTEVPAESFTWEYILLKTENQRSAARIISELNIWFADNGISATAQDWKAAAGPFSTTADVIRIVFNIAIILVAIVAIIIMTNTLVINVVERTAEIGTMRALGAHKGFIRRMVTTEVFTISVIFGFIGMLVGVFVLVIVGWIGFEATNPFLEILFAGPILKPVYSASSVFGSWVTVIIIGMIANIYPLRLALKVQPIKAMMSE